MQKYKCIKEFYLPKYDENECPDGYVGESDIRLYLENGDDDFGYIDITYKTLEEYFERID